MIGLNRQLNHRPVMFSYYLADDLFQACPHRPNEHLPSSLGAPDDVVHNEVDAMLLVLIIHVDKVLHSNTTRKGNGPFIPRLKAGAFWPSSVTMRAGGMTAPPRNLGSVEEAVLDG